jgi:hypothetical protein
MDDFEDGGVAPISNRNSAFGGGMIGGQAMYGNGLAKEAARFNASVPHAYRPSSSGNGMSTHQYQSTLGGAFPTSNGIAAGQYDVWKYSQHPGGAI